MLSRRNFTLFSVASLLCPNRALSQSAYVVTDDEFPPLPSDLLKHSAEDDYFGTELQLESLGTADPGSARIKMAQEIAAKAPRNCRPIDVAYYFRDLGRGKTEFGEAGRPYARGWPVMYNPLIVELFKATKMKPLDAGAGDTTPWCAAFVNYCIARAKSKDGNIGPDELNFGTRSPSSGSFRCFGKEIAPDDAKEGDIAVWAQDKTVNAASPCKPGSGHVGFFVAATGDAQRPYYIVGGNQGGDLLTGTDTRRDGMIQKAMPLEYAVNKGSSLKKRFLGFRRLI